MNQSIEVPTEEPTEAPPPLCVAFTINTVNRRSGPGTNYAVKGILDEWETRQIFGQKTGTDGFIWWQLADGSWVREDVVDEQGACKNVPVVP